MFLAGLFHLGFSGALTTMIVTVQLLFSTGQACILTEGTNLASLTVVLMLIVFLARLSYLKLFIALRATMVTVQLLFSTGQA